MLLRISSFILSDNKEISPDGAKQIGESVKRLSKLRFLDLDLHNNDLINDACVRDIVEARLDLESLDSLHMDLRETNVASKTKDSISGYIAGIKKDLSFELW